MIKAIELEGFRAFREPQVASLAPMTLVYGPNSAGKSTLVRSLLLLQQSVMLSNSPLMLMKGPLVDLGSARTVAHQHQGVARVSLEIDSQSRSRLGRTKIDFELDSSGPEGDIIRVFPFHGARNISLVFHRFGPNLQYLTLADESVDMFNSLESTLSGDSSIPLFREPVTQVPVFGVDALLPFTVVGRRSNGVFRRLSPSELVEPEIYWSSIGSELIDAFRSELESISYLGPLRRPWERSESISQDLYSPGVGANGQHALPVLARHPEILSRVNNDLKEALESSYQLTVTLLNESNLDGGVGAVLPPLVVPLLEHRESGVKVSPVDAGFGLSQLLPIVIEMNVRRNTLVCIEQPELHLHPRLQARVGQLLYKAVMGANSNRFLIETHSEHLLLRIRRLIREKLLPPDLVSILYVDNWEFDPETGENVSSSESRLTKIGLNEHGEFINPWPGGFFDERLSELPGWSDLDQSPRFSGVVDDGLF